MDTELQGIAYTHITRLKSMSVKTMAEQEMSIRSKKP